MKSLKTHTNKEAVKAFLSLGLTREQADFLVSGMAKFSRMCIHNYEDPLTEAIKMAKTPMRGSVGICLFDAEGKPVVLPDDLDQLEAMLSARDAQLAIEDAVGAILRDRFA